jgi:hypothetical protein
MGSAMGGRWWREARIGAARAFGARHYRKFAVVELVSAGTRQLLKWAVPLVAVAAVIALGWLGSRARGSIALPWVWIGLGAAAAFVVYLLAWLRSLSLAAWVAVLAGGGWLAWYAFTQTTAASPWIAGGALVVLLTALIGRRTWRYRRYRRLTEWID